MQLTINGKAAEAPDGCSLAELLKNLGYSEGGVSVALNFEFCPRGEHDTRLLREGDAVEIVAPLQGG